MSSIVDAHLLERWTIWYGINSLPTPKYACPLHGGRFIPYKATADLWQECEKLKERLAELEEGDLG